MKRRSARTRPPLKEKFTMTRKQVIAASLLFAVVVLLSGYVWYSVHTWRETAARTERTNDAIKGRIDRLQRDAPTLKKVKTTVDSMTAQIDDLCAVPPFVAWQQHVSSAARSVLTSCQTYQRTLTAVRDALQVLSARVDSEQQFTELLIHHRQAIKQTPPEELDAHLREWRSFITKVKTAKVHPSLEKTKQSAIATGQEVAAAYDMLIKADKEENRTDFDVAVAAIEKGYSKLGEIQNLSVESFSQLVDKVYASSRVL